MTFFSHVEFENHELVHFVNDSDTGLRAIIAVHNLALGPGLGGLRMFDYETDAEALTDVLRLSRGMTYKNALAEIPYGGGKSVILGDPRTEKSPEMMRAFGRALNKLGGNYITAEDVGTNVSDMDAIRSESPYARGTTHGVGDPSPYTAKGVRHAIHSAVKARLSTNDVRGIRIAVQGLGNVGYSLAQMLFDDGARLIVTDIDETRLAKAKLELNAEVMAPDAIFDANCDVFAPCAMGASINDATIDRISARVVCGAANNQLKDPEHAQALHERQILYVPDFVANAGGVINIALEGAASPEEIMTRVDNIRQTVDEILGRAGEKLLPVDVAETLARERIDQHAASTMAA